MAGSWVCRIGGVGMVGETVGDIGFELGMVWPGAARGLLLLARTFFLRAVAFSQP